MAFPFDAHANFAVTTVTVAPTPANSGTSLTVQSGTVFPAVPFNATVYPPSVNPLSSNAEIVRVTANASGVLTIVRAQESSTAESIAIGWTIIAGVTNKTLTDVQNAAGWAELTMATGTTYIVPTLTTNTLLFVGTASSGPVVITIPVSAGTAYLLRMIDSSGSASATNTRTLVPSSGSVFGSGAGSNVIYVASGQLTLQDTTTLGWIRAQ